MLEALYREHLDRITADAEHVLAFAEASEGGAARGFAGLVLHAGRTRLQHADDIELPFKPVAHFARFVPTAGSDHLLILRPGERPRLIRVVARDFWHAPAEPLEPFIAEALDVCEVATPEAAVAEAGDLPHFAYVGSDPEVAQQLGLPSGAVEPRAIIAGLDWARAIKTPFEVGCIREAVARAARGHAALRRAIRSGASEFALHLRYLEASDQLESELPYPSIIAWDAHSATLHHQLRTRGAPKPAATFLVDAGASCHGYASDLTRSHLGPGEPVHPVFVALLDGMDDLQRRCVAQVAPRRSYVDVHRFAEAEIAALLCETGVLRVAVDDALARGIVRPFFPHGVGHHLGLQVHDVGGRQVDPSGGISDPPPDCPNLRTTRTLDVGHVVTIEPGIYFIPQLLEPWRSGPERDAFDWKLVDALTPHGGIRIEDDVLVTHEGVEDLSRPVLPGHRDDAGKMADVERAG